MANPEQSSTFETRLKEQSSSALKDSEALIHTNLDWATREQRSDWGKVAETRLKGIFAEKAAEVEKAIALIQSRQLAEVAGLNETQLLGRHKAILGSLMTRFDLMMKVTAVESPTGKQDSTISSNADLYALREQGIALLESIDVQGLVYQNLPDPLKASYLEAMGHEFETLQPDYYEVLKKIYTNKPLAEEDWKLITGEVKELSTLSAMKRAPVMSILALLSPVQRYELAERLSKDPLYSGFDELIVTMTASTYLTRDQALALLDVKAKILDPKSSELVQIEQAKAVIKSARMDKTQEALLKRREEGVKRMSVSFGHKNRARGLLSLRGVGSIFLLANGAATFAANALVAIGEDGVAGLLNIPANPLVWAGAAQMGVGLQWSGGLEGTLPTPTSMLSKVLKDKDEEKDDKIQVNIRDFQEKLGNHPDAAHFYATYAHRIVKFYNEQKKKDPAAEVKITFEALGIQKKEDLPESLRPLYDKKAGVEALATEWVRRFMMGSETGVHRETSAEQVHFIHQDAVKAGYLQAFEIPKLPE